MRCIECESHAVVSGKLDCNYMNRLGLSQPTVKTFLEEAASPEKLEAKKKDIEKRKKELEDEIARLTKMKEEYGGEKKDEQQKM